MKSKLKAGRKYYVSKATNYIEVSAYIYDARDENSTAWHLITRDINKVKNYIRKFVKRCKGKVVYTEIRSTILIAKKPTKLLETLIEELQ